MNGDENTWTDITSIVMVS